VPVFLEWPKYSACATKTGSPGDAYETNVTHSDADPRRQDTLFGGDCDQMDITIRPMKPSDVSAVAALDLAAFKGDAWSPVAFQREVDENKLAHYFVLESAGGELWGALGCWAVIDEVHIVTISVDPAQQGQGLGEALALRAADLAKELAADVITLECRESNSSARALYAKLGFEHVGRRRRYYPDGEDALILTVQAALGGPYRTLIASRRALLSKRGVHIVSLD
jgi:ribosomal-protein-alanine N-acetyltransferase